MVLERYSLIGILFSSGLILLNLYLFRKGKLRSSTFSLWVIIGIAILSASSFPMLLSLVFSLLGTEILISAVTASSFLTLLLLVFYLHYRINDIEDKMMKITALASLSKYRQEETKKEEKRVGF